MLQGVDSNEVVLMRKIAFVHDFAKDTNIGKDLKWRLLHAIRYSSIKTGFSWVDKQDLFYELPKSLRYDISLAMYGGAIKKLPFFTERDPTFVS